MARHYDADDVPSIGDRRNNAIFVCHGDGRPEEWAPWLESFVSQFEGLKEQADRAGVALSWNGSALDGWQEFCEALGVSFDNDFWEGSFTSGHYYLVWLPVGKLRKAKTIARALLKTVERSALNNARTERLEELEEIDNLEEFLERTEDDRWSLQTTIQDLRKQLASVSAGRESATKALEKRAKEAENSNSTAFDREILQFACDVFTKRPAPFHAGSLAYWTDGAVYAIVRKGKGDLPADSSAACLIGMLETSGLLVHRLHDNEIVGGWLNGPYYREGSPYAKDWTGAWLATSRLKRTFVADDPAVVATAARIAQEITSWAK